MACLGSGFKTCGKTIREGFVDPLVPADQVCKTHCRARPHLAVQIEYYTKQRDAHVVTGILVRKLADSGMTRSYCLPASLTRSSLCRGPCEAARPGDGCCSEGRGGGSKAWAEGRESRYRGSWCVVENAEEMGL